MQLSINIITSLVNYTATIFQNLVQNLHITKYYKTFACIPRFIHKYLHTYICHYQFINMYVFVCICMCVTHEIIDVVVAFVVCNVVGDCTVSIFISYRHLICNHNLYNVLLKPAIANRALNVLKHSHYSSENNFNSIHNKIIYNKFFASKLLQYFFSSV